MRLFSHPILCNYYITYRCNAKCSFCDIWEKPSPYVTLDNYRANLKDLKRLGVKVIDFTGGEPLLHRELPRMLAEARQAGFITTVTTNGLLYPKLAGQLKGNVSMLHFSLDAPTAEAHNASRGVNCFGHVLRSLDIAKELAERPDVLYTITDASMAGIQQVYSEITRPRGLILILNPIFSYNGVGASLDEGHFAELRHWARRPGVYLNEAFLALRKAGGNHVAKPVCAAGSSTIVISPENELILPCYHLGANALPIENDLYILWHSHPVQAMIREEGRLPGCEGCTINCYMQPSFAFRLNSYFLKALPSTLKYAAEKWVMA